jgi:aminodeoxyfutalosine deaminase
MHNQETQAEDALFQKGNGAFLELYDAFLQGKNPVAPTGKSSLQSWLPYFTNGQTVLLVHNTFITEADILFAKKHAARHSLNIIFCICPNANLYIEGVLPPLDLLMKHEVQVGVGTDSYSSNWQLSIASEIKTVREKFPYIPLSTVLQWATSSAAAALGFAGLGSFEKGNRPGVVLLQENDLSVQRII